MTIVVPDWAVAVGVALVVSLAAAYGARRSTK